jgi:hypothetical protein
MDPDNINDSVVGFTDLMQYNYIMYYSLNLIMWNKTY